MSRINFVFLDWSSGQYPEIDLETAILLDESINLLRQEYTSLLIKHDIPDDEPVWLQAWIHYDFHETQLNTIK